MILCMHCMLHWMNAEAKRLPETRVNLCSPRLSAVPTQLHIKQKNCQSYQIVGHTNKKVPTWQEATLSKRGSTLVLLAVEAAPATPAAAPGPPRWTPPSTTLNKTRKTLTWMNVDVISDANPRNAPVNLRYLPAKIEIRPAAIFLNLDSGRDSRVKVKLALMAVF